jgi:hypothetical protein
VLKETKEARLLKEAKEKDDMPAPSNKQATQKPPSPSTPSWPNGISHQHSQQRSADVRAHKLVGVYGNGMLSDYHIAYNNKGFDGD